MPTAAMKGYLQLDKIPEEEIAPLISRKLVAGEREMVVFWRMKAGAHAAAHRHPHEQIFWVLSGTMEFRLGDEKRNCRAGDMGVIPSGVEHEARFPEDTEVIDIFSPPREDFLAGGTPAYMRKG